MPYTKAIGAAGGLAASGGLAATGAFGGATRGLSAAGASGATRGLSAAGAFGANQALGAAHAATGGALAFTGVNVGWDVLAIATACISAGLVLRFVPRKAKV
jgi:hypothetical protein